MPDFENDLWYFMPISTTIPHFLARKWTFYDECAFGALILIDFVPGNLGKMKENLKKDKLNIPKISRRLRRRHHFRRIIYHNVYNAFPYYIIIILYIIFRLGLRPSPHGI